MLNINQIEDAIRVWVDDVTSLEAIFAHPNAQRPITPYVLINFISATSQGTKEKDLTLLPDDSVDIDYSNLEELFVSINTYYAGAFQTTTKLKDSLDRVTVSEKLYAAGLGYLRSGTVQEIPEEIDKRWEERGQFDVFFSTRSLDEENIESIQKIEITNNIDDDGDTVIIEKP